MAPGRAGHHPPHRRTLAPGILAITALLLFLGGLAGSIAATLHDTYRVHDRGQRREFEVARDEFYSPGWPPARLSHAPLPSAEASRKLAVEVRKHTGAPVALVLYERGVPRNEFTRRILTPQVLAQLAQRANHLQVAQHAASVLNPPDQTTVDVVPTPFPGWVLFRTSDPDGALELAEQLRRFPEVLWAEAQLAHRQEAKFTPNDPLFPQQWHLLNTGQNGGTPGCDLNVAQVWDAWRGSGVTVGIVDDGVQVLHPDLAPNLITALGTNINTGIVGTDYGRHGSPVAGLVGARGDNGIGVTGVAFESGLVDIRLLGDPTTDEQEALAMRHANDQIQIKNNSWGAYDGDGTLQGAGPLMAAALAEAATSGRDGRGTLFVFAGGNGRAFGENVNYDGYANSPYAIAVGAVTDQAGPTSYSEPGACLVACAPSGSGTRLCSAGRQALTSTDLLGSSGYNYPGAFCELASPDYTQNFSGTSGATALASGVLALMLQANPALGWRDAKEILMRSARKVVPADADWQTNSAGLPHSHRFGAGMVDARRAVELATQWFNLAPLQTISQAQTGLNLPVPDNQTTGVVSTLTFTNAGFRVETVAVHVTLPHEHFGDLAVTLTSPKGTISRLAELHNSTGAGYDDWTFTSVRHWGEPALGAWTLRIADVSPTRTGTVQSVRIDLLGSVPQAHLALSSGNTACRARLSAAAPGWTYALDISTNLLQWQPLTSLRITDAGTAVFDDQPAADATRFYRARLVE